MAYTKQALECTDLIALLKQRGMVVGDETQKYPSEKMPPAWKTLEVVTFGTLSKLFYNLKDNSVKRQISRDYHVPHQKFLESWVKSIAHLLSITYTVVL